MHRYLVWRIAQVLPTLFLASIAIFLIITLAPGDPALMSLGEEATREELEAERVRMGLYKPLPVRYAIWLGDVARLNLGTSLVQNRPVTTLIKEAVPNTLRLALAGMVVALPIGFALGIAAALKQDSWIDSLVTGFNALALSVPSFWLGIILVLVFAVWLKWLPPSGTRSLDKSWIYDLRYLILPVTSLSFGRLAVFSRFVRSSLLDVMSADYVRTARAKGLRERIVVSRHALKNAMIPVLTIVGVQFGKMLGGAVVTESVFAYSGMGRLVMTAIRNRDYPVVQGGLMVVVLIFLLTNFVVDMSYGYLDPRIGYERSR